jgi:hypothetical protein
MIDKLIDWISDWFIHRVTDLLAGILTRSSSSFTVGPVGFPTVGTAAYRLIVPPCFGSHLSPPCALRAQMSRKTSGRERENYEREMVEWIYLKLRLPR